MNRLLISALGLVVLSGVAAASQTFTYSTASDNASLPLNASITFSESAGVLTVTLSNLLDNGLTNASDFKAANQALSGFFFSISGMPSPGLGTVSGSGNFIDINSSAAGGVSDLGNNSMGWGSSVSGSQIRIDDLVSGQSPKNTLIGGSYGTTTQFGSANSSLTGNHNPFAEGTATWTINVSGLTSTSLSVALPSNSAPTLVSSTRQTLPAPRLSRSRLD